MTTQELIEKKEAKIVKLQDQINNLKLENIEPKETTESFLDKIFNKDLICKKDPYKYPNSVFYFDGETFLIEIEKTEEKILAWVNNVKIWNPISEKFGLHYYQTQHILKVKIEEHFKLRDVTPASISNQIVETIEEHFKLRDVTPSNKN
jgi:hypothetical protein